MLCTAAHMTSLFLSIILFAISVEIASANTEVIENDRNAANPTLDNAYSQPSYLDLIHSDLPLENSGNTSAAMKANRSSNEQVTPAGDWLATHLPMRKLTSPPVIDLGFRDGFGNWISTFTFNNDPQNQTPLFPAFDFTDSDGDSLHSVTIRIQSGCRPGDVLAFTPYGDFVTSIFMGSNSVTYSNNLEHNNYINRYLQWEHMTGISLAPRIPFDFPLNANSGLTDPATPTCEIKIYSPSGEPLASDWVAAIRTVRFFNVLPVPSVVNRIVSVTLEDKWSNCDTHLAATSSATMTFKAYNNPPVINPGPPVTATENDSKAIFNNVDIWDWEDQSVEKVYISISPCSISDNLALADDFLLPPGISAAYADSTEDTSPYDYDPCTFVMTGMGFPIGQALDIVREVKYTRNGGSSLPHSSVDFVIRVTESSVSLPSHFNGPQVSEETLTVQVYPDLSPSISCPPDNSFISGETAKAVFQSISITTPFAVPITSAIVAIFTGCTEHDTITNTAQFSSYISSFGLSVDLIYTGLHSVPSQEYPCMLKVTGSATPVEYETLLNELQFRNWDSKLTNGQREILIQVSTEQGIGQCAFFVEMQGVNKQPQILKSAKLSSWFEVSGLYPVPVHIDLGLSLSDPDDHPIQSAKVVITSGCSEGDILQPSDWLAGEPNSYSGGPSWAPGPGPHYSAVNPPSNAGWTFSYTGAMGTPPCELSITSSTMKTTEDFQAALRTIQFTTIRGAPTGHSPTLTNRQITVSVVDNPPAGTVVDGALTGSTVYSFTIVPINDAPQVVLDTDVIPFVWGSSPVLPFQSLSIQDTDSAKLSRAIICSTNDGISLSSYLILPTGYSINSKSLDAANCVYLAPTSVTAAAFYSQTAEAGEPDILIWINYLQDIQFIPTPPAFSDGITHLSLQVRDTGLNSLWSSISPVIVYDSSNNIVEPTQSYSSIFLGSNSTIPGASVSHTYYLPEKQAAGALIGDLASIMYDPHELSIANFAIPVGNESNFFSLTDSILTTSVFSGAFEDPAAVKSWQLLVSATIEYPTSAGAKIYLTLINVNIYLTDVNEKPSLSAPAFLVFNELPWINALDDDLIPAPPSTPQSESIVISDYDISDENAHILDIRCIFPPENSPQLNNLSCSDIFTFQHGTSTRLLEIHPYTTAIEVLVKPTVTLESFPVKSIVVELIAQETNRPVAADDIQDIASNIPLESDPIIVVFLVQRPNSPVTILPFGGTVDPNIDPIDYPPGPFLWLTVAENSPVGTVINSSTNPNAQLYHSGGNLEVQVEDKDAKQILNYSITSVSSCPANVIEVFELPKAPADTIRKIQFLVARDILDYEDWPEPCDLQVTIADDGVPPNAYHPLQTPTMASFFVRLSLVDVSDLPVITALAGEPDGGYPLAEVQVIRLIGQYLGPIGLEVEAWVGWEVGVTWIPDDSTLALPLPDLIFKAQKCIVVVRMTEIECQFNGYGRHLTWQVRYANGYIIPYVELYTNFGAPVVLNIRAPTTAELTQATYSDPLDAMFDPFATITIGDDLSTGNGDPLYLPSIASALETLNLDEWLIHENAIPNDLEDEVECDNDNLDLIVDPSLGSSANSACSIGGRRIVLEGYNFPHISDWGTALTFVRFGPTGTEFLARACEVLTSFSKIICWLPPGTGTQHKWTVGVGNAMSTLPTSSYGAPIIFALATPGLLPTDGTGVIAIFGNNFGTRAGAQVMAEFKFETPPPNEFEDIGIVRTKDCEVLADHIIVSCSVPPGYFEGTVWRVIANGYYSEWSTAKVDFQPPSITSPFLPRVPTSGQTIIELKGTNFGKPGAARLWFAGVMKDPYETFHLSDSRILTMSDPGIGSGKNVTLEVGPSRFASIGFNYALPTIEKIIWLDGYGTIEQPLKVKIVGENFGECCWCRENTSSCTWLCDGLIGCLADPEEHPPAILSKCQHTCYFPGDDELSVLGVQVDSNELENVVLKSDGIEVEMQQKLGNITVRVGDQFSAQVEFNIDELLSDQSTLTSLSIIGNTTQNFYLDTAGNPVPPVSNFQDQSPNSKGHSVLYLRGENLQQSGIVVFESEFLGRVECPFVYSTLYHVKPSAGGGSVSIPTIYGHNKLLPLYNATSGEVTEPENVHTYPPMAIPTVVNDREMWSTEPVLCYIISWYDSPQASVSFGSVLVSVPPGQGIISVYTSSPQMNRQSINKLPMRYAPPKVTSITPDTGPTTGLVISIGVSGISPMRRMYDVWQPYLTDDSNDMLQEEKAPIYSVGFYLSEYDTSPSECTIVTWEIGTITCQIPRGIPNLPYRVRIRDTTGTISPYGDSGFFRYDPGVLFQTWPPPHGPTAGGFNVTLYGQSLGAAVNGETEKSVRVTMVPVTGEGYLEKDKTTSIVLDVLEHDHEHIIIKIPSGEGSARISVSYQLPLEQQATVTVNPEILRAQVQNAEDENDHFIVFKYDPIEISSIHALENPCNGLREEAIRDDPPLPGIFYPGSGLPGSGDFLCFRARNYPRSSPFQGDILNITGLNFGHGKAETSVTIDEVPCGVPFGGNSIWRSDNEIVCQLSDELPSSFSTITIAAAFNSVTFMPQVVDAEIIAYAPPSADGFPLQLRSTCPKSMYLESEGGYCQDCPDGAVCLGGSFVPTSLNGYWETNYEEWLERGINVNEVDVPRFVQCPLPESCLANGQCAVGHMGFMCTQCLPGYSGGSTTLCTPCDKDEYNIAILALTFAAACVFGAVLIRRAMARKSKFVIVLKMLINFLQMSSVFRVYNAANAAPNPIKNFIQTSGISNYLSLDFQAATCAGKLDYTTRFASYLMIPPVAVLFPTILLVIYNLYIMLRYKEPISYSRIRRTVVTCVYVLLFFVQNTVVTQILMVWNCASLKEGGYLIADPSVSCQSEGHKFLARYIAPAFLCLYGIGIPLFAIVILYNIRHAMHTRRYLKYYGFMYDGFDVKGGKWWYESAIMIRKMCFVAIGVVVASQGLQLIAGTVLMVSVIIFHVQVKPFAERALNNLETLSLLGNLSLYFGLLLLELVSRNDLNPAWGEGVSVFCLIVQAIVILRFCHILFYILRMQLRAANELKRQEQIQRRIHTVGQWIQKRSAHSEKTTEVVDGEILSLTRTQKAIRCAEKVASRRRAQEKLQLALLVSVPRNPPERRHWMRAQSSIGSQNFTEDRIDSTTDSSYSDNSSITMKINPLNTSKSVSAISDLTMNSPKTGGSGPLSGDSKALSIRTLGNSIRRLSILKLTVAAKSDPKGGALTKDQARQTQKLAPTTGGKLAIRDPSARSIFSSKASRGIDSEDEESQQIWMNHFNTLKQTHSSRAFVGKGDDDDTDYDSEDEGEIFASVEKGGLGSGVLPLLSYGWSKAKTNLTKKRRNMKHAAVQCGEDGEEKVIYVSEYYLPGRSASQSKYPPPEITASNIPMLPDAYLEMDVEERDLTRKSNHPFSTSSGVNKRNPLLTEALPVKRNKNPILELQKRIKGSHINVALDAIKNGSWMDPNEGSADKAMFDGLFSRTHDQPDASGDFVVQKTNPLFLNLKLLRNDLQSNTTVDSFSAQQKKSECMTTSNPLLNHIRKAEIASPQESVHELANTNDVQVASVSTKSQGFASRMTAALNRNDTRAVTTSTGASFNIDRGEGVARVDNGVTNTSLPGQTNPEAVQVPNNSLESRESVIRRNPLLDVLKKK